MRYSLGLSNRFSIAYVGRVARGVTRCLVTCEASLDGSGQMLTSTSDAFVARVGRMASRVTRCSRGSIPEFQGT